MTPMERRKFGEVSGGRGDFVDIDAERTRWGRG